MCVLVCLLLQLLMMPDQLGSGLLCALVDLAAGVRFRSTSSSARLPAAVTVPTCTHSRSSGNICSNVQLSTARLPWCRPCTSWLLSWRLGLSQQPAVCLQQLTAAAMDTTSGMLCASILAPMSSACICHAYSHCDVLRGCSQVVRNPQLKDNVKEYLYKVRGAPAAKHAV
jgi:hypothetical protein